MCVVYARGHMMVCKSLQSVLSDGFHMRASCFFRAARTVDRSDVNFVVAPLPAERRYGCMFIVHFALSLSPSLFKCADRFNVIMFTFSFAPFALPFKIFLIQDKHIDSTAVTHSSIFIVVNVLFLLLSASLFILLFRTISMRRQSIVFVSSRSPLSVTVHKSSMFWLCVLFRISELANSARCYKNMNLLVSTQNV